MGVLSKGDHPTWGAAIKAFVLSPYFICAHLCHIIAMAVMISQHVDLQWYWLLLYSWATVPLSPWVSDAVKFLRGGLDDDKRSATSLGYLACSSFVAWVFAKSIYNSSTLGAKYGISGGLAYAGYYTSFASVAIAVFFMRTRHGYQSLPEAICMRYGPTAALVFGLCVLYRLFQEVWSNSLVVGSFYGGVHSNEWWAAVIVSTAIPAFYSFTGGMRSSLLTDTFQAVWKTVLLIVVLVVIGIQRTQLPGPPEFGTFNPAGTCSLPAPAPITFPGCATATGNPLNPATNYTSLLDPVKSSFTFTNASCSPYTAFNLSTCAYVGATVVPPKCSPTTEPACDQAGGSWTPRPMTSLTGGMDLLAVALLQGCLSYPFFDPVLTDRAFLAEPHTMLTAFMIGGAVAATFIILFSFVGIMGAMQTILAPQDVSVVIFTSMRAGIPAAVASFFGTAVYSLLNLVFIISSCAVLDSTFASTAKLFGPEFFGLLQHGRPSPPSAAKPLHLIAGRVMIVVLAVCGTLPLMQSPTALDATTVSGTMVMGLGPPVWALTFIKGYRPLVFHLPFWSGLALGIVFQLSTDPCCKDNINVDSWGMGQGAYRMLLGFNVIGVAVCWGLGLIALVENWQSFNLLEEGALSLLGAATRGWDAFAARLPTHWNVPKIGKAGALSYSAGKVPELDLQPSRSESSAAGGATHEPPGTTAYPSPSAPPLRPAAPTS